MQLKSFMRLGWGCLALMAGCGGPEASGSAAPALGHTSTALAEGLGSWTMSLSTGYLPYDYRHPVRLRSSGEILAVNDHHVARYNPYNDTWRTMNDACVPGSCRVRGLTSLSSGLVLATVGNTGRRGDTWSLKLYDPAADGWRDLSSAGFDFPSYSPSADFSLGMLGSGRILQSGGFTYSGDTRVPLSGAAEYDPSTQTWSAVGSMNAPRTGHRSVLLYSGNVLVLGGGSATAEIYEPAKKTWARAALPPFPGTPDLSLRLNSGLVMAVVATDGAPTSAVHFYDPYNNRWLAGPALPMAQPVSALLLYSGEVFVTNDAGDAALYNPAQGVWLAAAHGAGLSNTFSVLLTSGQVFRIGGNRHAPHGQRYTR